MSPRTRRGTLCDRSYRDPGQRQCLGTQLRGLYDWAVHTHLSGWQAKSWPAELKVFVAVRELAYTSPTSTAGQPGRAYGGQQG
jgi:hypothetical protein